ncbi:transposase [Streptoalloteichus tenebrarius]|uniref:transposase n=1 Tax=Streptoalloteichus tenebrarius (strain ATCC 17920 / DSM 40477 / JCM 4838 / CBS 697.72 / NBRC 16177 / NCIMB 11028 / NRRL B-12390 / A12253. 1 / ISP 5477) TaxID=1933 RepID=UPI003555F757
MSGRGRGWRDHRQVITAILGKPRTGAPWRNLPNQYGPWKIAHERLSVVGPRTTPGSASSIGGRQGRRGWRVGVDRQRRLQHRPWPTITPPAPGENGGCAAGIEVLAAGGEGLGRSRGALHHDPPRGDGARTGDAAC